MNACRESGLDDMTCNGDAVSHRGPEPLAPLLLCCQSPFTRSFLPPIRTSFEQDNCRPLCHMMQPSFIAITPSNILLMLSFVVPAYCGSLACPLSRSRSCVAIVDFTKKHREHQAQACLTSCPPNIAVQQALTSLWHHTRLVTLLPSSLLGVICSLCFMS